MKRKFNIIRIKKLEKAREMRQINKILRVENIPEDIKEKAYNRLRLLLK